MRVRAFACLLVIEFSCYPREERKTNRAPLSFSPRMKANLTIIAVLSPGSRLKKVEQSEGGFSPSTRREFALSGVKFQKFLTSSLLWLLSNSPCMKHSWGLHSPLRTCRVASTTEKTAMH